MAATKNEAFIALQHEKTWKLLFNGGVKGRGGVRVTFEGNLWRREWKFGRGSLLVEGIFPGKGNEQIIGYGEGRLPSNHSRENSGIMTKLKTKKYCSINKLNEYFKMFPEVSLSAIIFQ